MSARTPFIPQRPASRAHANQPGINTESISQQANDTFRPTVLLPVSAPSGEKHDSQSLVHQVIASDAENSGLKSKINKPLNISSFVKNNTSQQGNHPPGRSRKSFEDAGARSRSPKPNQQALRMAAPRPSSPFFPNSSGLVSMNGFKAPSLPVPSKLQTLTSADDLSSNKAHIPISAVPPPSDMPHGRGLTQDDDAEMLVYPAAFHPSAMQHRVRTASHPSLEKITEEDEMERPRTSSGRRKSVPSDFDELEGDGPTGNTAFVERGDGYGEQGLRRSAKRVHCVEEDEDIDYGGNAKRYKGDRLPQEPPPSYSRHSTPASHYLPTSQGAHDDDHDYRRTESHYEDTFPSQAQAGVDGLAQPAHAFRKLLGQDLNLYMDAHLNAYDEAKKKWSECSIDEWRAGADGASIKTYASVS